jgi:hypothetical protein
MELPPVTPHLITQKRQASLEKSTARYGRTPALSRPWRAPRRSSEWALAADLIDDRFLFCFSPMIFLSPPFLTFSR